MGEQQLTQLYGNAMRAISSSFSDDFGLIDLLHHIVEECRDVLDIADVGIVLADSDGQLHVLAATSERSSLVEALQIEAEAGPCMESYRTASTAVIQDFYGREDRFAQLARQQGFKSVYATPLRRHIYSIGALNLFSERSHAFTEDVRAIADAFGRIAAMAVFVDRSGHGTRDRIDEALQARIDIEQAKGVLMAQARIDEPTAFARVHQYARDNMRSLVSVARDITSLRLRV